MKKYEVKCKSVEEFLEKYTKYERHKGRGVEYANERILTYKKELVNNGFTFLSRHESITGDGEV